MVSASMNLRWLLREARDFPVTATLCILWIAVFVAMVVTRLSLGVPTPLTKWLFVGIGDGHRFGDLALQDLAHGEYWRLMTSTFVHFSVIHLVLNLIAMYQLGTMVESWYGGPQSVFIYGLTGAGGNLISVLIRHWIGSNPKVHSGGGSVVIMGLVGLCAVVGLRSRTDIGLSMGRLMVFFMLATAAMGAALHQFIDNWGHAGGAIVGIALGFAHRNLSNNVDKPAAWGRGVITGILIAGCAAAQVAADRRETPLREEQTQMRRVAELERNYQLLARTAFLVRRGGNTKTMLELLDGLSDASLAGGPAQAEIEKLRALVKAAKAGRLSAEQARELDERLQPLVETARRDFTDARKKQWRPRIERRL
jgi:rhomboid protease GluP